jgi:hypothetical protein
MDSRERDDELLKYMVSGTKQMAPEGFTEKVMTRATLERVTRASRYESPVRPLFIAAAGVVAFTLIIIALLLPDGDSTGRLPAFLKELTGSFNLSLPHLKPIQLPDTGFDIPSLFVYLAIALFLLTLFDRALSGYFSRKRESDL